MKQILAAVVLLLSSITNAANVVDSSPFGPFSYVVESSPGVVTGIGNLYIGGNRYNVDFAAGVFDTFGGTEDFWSSEGDAVAAVNAVHTILNALEYGYESEVTINNVAGNTFAVHFPLDGVVISQKQLDFPAWRFPQVCPDSDPSCAYSWGSWAIGTSWSVATVPLPAAGYFLLSALCGLITIKLRQKATQPVS